VIQENTEFLNCLGGWTGTLPLELMKLRTFQVRMCAKAETVYLKPVSFSFLSHLKFWQLKL
jgi:hypothetical protein